MKFLFILLLLLSPVFASLDLGIDDKESWSFKGDFSKKTNKGISLQGEFEVSCHLKGHLKTISCLRYPSGSAISIQFDAEFSQQHPEFTREIDKTDTDLPSDEWVFSKINDPLSLLKPLHDQHIVPDFVMTRILSEMNLDDFRINAQFVIQSAEKSLSKNASFSDLIEAIEAFFLTIKSKEKIERVRWELIQIFLEESPAEEALLEIFCSKITDRTLPFFDDSRRVLMNFQLLNIKRSDSAKRAIGTLLSIQNPDKNDSRLLNNCVKDFMDGDIFTSHPLPKELQDLSCTPETILNLLDYIQKNSYGFT